MSVKNPKLECAPKSGPASVANPSPRRNKPGYADRCEERRKQGSKCAPQKNRTMMVGRSNPPAPGVGRDRDANWNGTWRLIKGEHRMDGRGNARLMAV